MTDLLSESPVPRAISVSELNRQARAILEGGLAKLWVEGEISNLARPASGHLYFSLKDASAQIRCAYFRQRQRGPTLQLKNGDQVLVFGKVSIYEARGEFQMIVEQIEDAGEGELQRRFEALKKSLAAEGLFDEAHKQDIPAMPYRIGIVTSPSGAAIRDVLTVLKRRFPAIPVMIYPAAVQGVAAIAQLTAALETATDRNECDVIIVTRGGGSLEDLWAFNEEAVARAIHACPIPVISAIGHEIDFTIADFVADLRAPTPSGAAEIVVPDQAEWLRALEAAATRVESLARRCLEDRYQRVDWLSKRLSQSSPGATVARQMAWLKNLQQLMNAATRHGLSVQGRQLDAAKARLLRNSPAIGVQRSISRLGSARHNLIAAGMAALQRRKAQLKLAERSLTAISPLATLERGYAVVVDEASGKILRDSVDVVAGSNICARLAKGALKATVTETTDSADG